MNFATEMFSQTHVSFIFVVVVVVFLVGMQRVSFAILDCPRKNEVKHESQINKTISNHNDTFRLESMMGLRPRRGNLRQRVFKFHQRPQHHHWIYFLTHHLIQFDSEMASDVGKYCDTNEICK